MSKALQSQGLEVGRYQAATLMRKQCLVAIQPKSYVPRTTDSKHHLGRSANLLLERAACTGPNQVHVGDITYIPLRGGKFLYLATFQDMYSRKITGWELLGHMRSELVVNALNKSINRRALPRGLIIHSDGGGQYAGHVFKKLLASQGFYSSMTRRGNHYDNAMAESLFGHLKTELMDKGAFNSLEDAYTEIFEYIEIYYNTKRLHSSIAYQTPQAFEEAWEKEQQLPKNESKTVG